MASILKVDKLDPQSAAALEIGTSGDTISIPSGATLDISASTLTPPAIMPASSGINFTALNATNLGTGTVPTARLGSGTASSSTFLRGDQTYAAAGGDAIGHSIVYLDGDVALSGSGYLDSLVIYSAGAAGTGIVDDVTSGHIRVDKTGWYLCLYQFTGNSTSGTQTCLPYIATWNGTSETDKAYGYAHGDNDDDDTFTVMIMALIDIDNVTDVKLHMKYTSADNITLYASADYSVTSMTLIRLGDT